MLRLNNLKSVSKKRNRVGRGGDRGGTSGRGHKGQKARSGVGGELKCWFEGGQMPMSRRFPRRGFTNSFKKDVQILNLNDLEAAFAIGDHVDRGSLVLKGLIKKRGKFLVKILGNGELTKNITVQVDRFSKSAIEAIEKVGGKIKKVEKVEISREV